MASNMTRPEIKNTFLDRLHWLLGGRKPHPWGAGIGWGTGVIYKTMQGVIPGHAYLIALARAENVNLNWILTGEGRPYLVATCRDDEEAADLIKAHLADAADWSVFVLRSGDRTGIAMTLPGSYGLKGKDYPYTAIEVITGPIGPKTLLALQKHRLNKTAAMVDMSSEEMESLERGELGTWDLTREGGILQRRGGAALQTQLLYVAEGKPAYTAFTLAGKRERKLIERLRQLDDDDLGAVEGLLDRLPGKRS